LAGDKFEHRKAWIEERHQYLSRCFAVEIAGFAAMSNHLHVIVRMDSAVAQQWSALEVARRWASIYPKKYLSDGTPALPN
jgi:REP element-mobilizing transposase RayT